jgi:soluble lytic murein transglycosylase-like protein
VASPATSVAAVQTVALEAGELDPPKTVVPTPRPAVTTLAYAAQPKTVAALSAMDQKLDFPPAPGEPIPPTASEAKPELLKLIKRYAGLYGVPESLVHRVVHRESKYDPNAYHKNGYWGLMQIKYSTAKSMGYQGPPEGLLDPETNLKYAIKYLRGAWLVADNKNDNAIKLYARGYYNDAKRKDMLQVLEK